MITETDVQPMLIPQLSSTRHVTEDKLRGFLGLRVGWHYGEGDALSEQTIQRALSLHAEAIAQGLYMTDAFPGLGGQVMITIYNSADYLEFVLELDGSVTYTRDRHRQEVDYRELASDLEAKRVLQSYREELWKRSASSAESCSTTLGTDASRAWLLRTLGSFPGASPLLTDAVYLRREAQSVIISEAITGESQLIRQYSGSSPQVYSPQSAS